MYGVALSSFADVALPDARQCLIVFGPFLAVAVVWWLINRMDVVIAFLFPNHPWERELGWLNIRAEKRADAVLRWLGYFFYAVLAIALYGIVWSVQAVPSLDDRSTEAIRKLLERLPVFLMSVGLWLVYLGFALIPKLRGQYEMEELEKFRAEQKVLEEERDRMKAAKGAAFLGKLKENPWRMPRRGDGP